MSTQEVSSILAHVDGLNIHQLPLYQQSVEENNINGMVLSQCELDELGKVLGMKFGDWQLFRTVILSLREAELDQQRNETAEEEIEMAQNARRARTNSVMSTRSIHFQENENSGSGMGSEPSRSRHSFGQQVSIDVHRPDSSEAAHAFDTIQEVPEAPPRSKMQRNDSVVQEMMYESNLLRQAMQSFAEEDEEQEEEVEERREIPSSDIQSSKKRGLPVQFSLSSDYNGSFPHDYRDTDNENQNAECHVTSELDPLIMRKKSDLDFHPPSEHGSPRPILKKPRNNNNTRTGSQYSLSNNQLASERDMSGSEPDLNSRRHVKSPDLLHTDKSISLSSTGFTAERDQRQASVASSKGDISSRDSFFVISELQKERDKDTVSLKSIEKSLPQRTGTMSIEDSIKHFTISQASSLSSVDRAPLYGEYSPEHSSGLQSPGAFSQGDNVLHIFEEVDLVSGSPEKLSNAESSV